MARQRFHWARLWHAVVFWIATMVALVGVSLTSHRLTPPWQAVANGLAGALLAWALSHAFLRWDGIAPGDARLAPDRHTPVRLLSGILAGAAMAVLFVALLHLSGCVAFKRVARPGAEMPVLMAMGFLLLAAREEIAFRGYLLRTLETGIGRWPALLLMAALFAIEHALSRVSLANVVVGAGLGAVVFGMAAIATRSLAFPIGLHAAWNTIDWASGGKGGPGLWQRVALPGDEMQAQALGLALYASVMALALFALWRYDTMRSRTLRREA